MNKILKYALLLLMASSGMAQGSVSREEDLAIEMARERLINVTLTAGAWALSSMSALEMEYRYIFFAENMRKQNELNRTRSALQSTRDIRFLACMRRLPYDTIENIGLFTGDTAETISQSDKQCEQNRRVLNKSFVRLSEVSLGMVLAWSVSVKILSKLST